MLDHSPTDPHVTPPRPGRPRTPVDLWEAVLSARIDLALERASLKRCQHPTARAALVGALEAYILSLAERGHPVPYALRDEVRLQRLTCTDRHGSQAAYQQGPHTGTQT